MSLPSFLFNADAYTGDTPHLTVEEHGAYLLLMLAYYRMEKPLPASDRALASICKMTAEQWGACKPTLAPFFIEEDGTWRHARVEREIAKRNEEVAKFRARATAGANARWGDKKSLPAAKPMLRASVTHAELELESISLSARAIELEKEPPPEAPPKPPEDIGSTISPDFILSPAIMERIGADVDASTLHLEIQKFKFHHREQGTWSHDWQATFEKWWARFVEHQKKNAKPKAAPRVEVNAEPNWDWYISRWKKNQSMWSYKSCGPEPGQVGCRAPPDVLRAHGIDPTTGNIIRETTT